MGLKYEPSSEPGYGGGGHAATLEGVRNTLRDSGSHDHFIELPLGFLVLNPTP